MDGKDRIIAELRELVAKQASAASPDANTSRIELCWPTPSSEATYGLAVETG